MNRLKTKTSGIWIFSDYKKTSTKILYIVFLIILSIVAFISIFPPLWLFLSSFKTPDLVLSDRFVLFPATFDLGVIARVWQEFAFGKYYLNSLFLVLGAIVCSVVFNGLLAYVTAVLKPKGWKVVHLMIVATLMIPAVINISPLYINIIKTFDWISEVIGQNVWNIPYFSYLPLWLVYGANAYYYLLFHVYFQSIPKELFEAAQIDGANKIQMFRHLLFPLAMPIIAVVTIFTMNAAWSDFLLPSLMTQIDQTEAPIMVRLYQMYSDQMAQVTLQERLMTIMFSVVPPIVFFLIFQKKIAQNVATSGLKE